MHTRPKLGPPIRQEVWKFYSRMVLSYRITAAQWLAGVLAKVPHSTLPKTQDPWYLVFSMGVWVLGIFGELGFLVLFTGSKGALSNTPVEHYGSKKKSLLSNLADLRLSGTKN